MLDGEAVIINLATGNYYTLNKDATLIWGYLIKGHNLREIYDGLGVQDGKIKESIKNFVSNLEKEKLLFFDEKVLKSETSITFEKIKEIDPVINIFTDMQEFMEVDPIHDVDERGWPHLKED